MNEEATLTLPDGRHLAYADYGDPDGRPVLYFHGWPSSRYQGKLLDAAAAARGLRIIAPDRPGLGRSDPRAGRHFADWPEDVAGLADSLGIGRFHLMGISGGAPYTLATAAALPERVVATAIVCGAPPLDAAGRAAMHPAYRILARMRPVRRAVMPVVVATSRWMISRGADRAPMSWMLASLPTADREAILDTGCWESVTRSYLEGVRPGCAGMLAEGELYLEDWDFDPASIRCPIAFWHGLEDRNLPCDAARRLAARVPGAECHWLAGEGHYSLPLRHREEILDWLADRA